MTYQVTTAGTKRHTVFYNVKQFNLLKYTDIAQKYSETSVRTTRKHDVADHKTESFRVHVVVILDIAT
jgi:hypothetical protein